MNAIASTTGHAPPRVAPNLSHAFGGIWRLTLRRFFQPMHGLVVLGGCAVLVVLSLPATHSPEAARTDLLPWAIRFYLTFIVPILAFISAGGAMRDEMKAGNVDYVFTRPVPRPMFIGFKFLSHLACAQLDFLVSLATIVGIGLYRQFPHLWSAVPALLGGQLLIVTAFSALGFLCGIITSRYIIVGLAYGAVIEVGVGQIPTQLNKLSMTHQVQGMLQALLLNGEKLLASSANNPPDATVAGTITLLLGFTAIALFLASGIFSFLELSGPNES